jgi:glycogen(starch) synthase
VRDLPLLHAYYARAHDFVHATHYEGSSIVTLEAMAHSLPVVATGAGGIPDKVQDGVNGYLVEPKDVAGLTEAIARLVADEPGRQAFGVQSRARVEQWFSWDKIARETTALYEDLLRQAAAGSQQQTAAQGR